MSQRRRLRLGMSEFIYTPEEERRAQRAKIARKALPLMMDLLGDLAEFHEEPAPEPQMRAAKPEGEEGEPPPQPEAPLTIKDKGELLRGLAAQMKRIGSRA